MGESTARRMMTKIELMRNRRVNPEFMAGARAVLQAMIDSGFDGSPDPVFAFEMEATRPENLARGGRRIVMDLDGVLLNIDQAIIDIVNAERGTTFVFDDIRGWGHIPIFSGTKEFKEFFMFHPEIFRSSLPHEGAREFVQASLELAREHKVPFLFYSGVFCEWDFRLKNELVWKYFGDDLAKIFKVGFGDKRDVFVEGDIVIEDCTKNLETAKEVGGFPVCIARPWNDPKNLTPYHGERYDYEGALKKIKELLR